MFSNTRFWLISVLITSLLIFVFACDVYEDEADDFPNDVTLEVINLSTCLVDLFIDGVDLSNLNPRDSHIEENLGQGFHLLVVYPWNDDYKYCDILYTHELVNGDVFRWEILPTGGCVDCDPTPTPMPTQTPSPTVDN